MDSPAAFWHRDNWDWPHFRSRLLSQRSLQRIITILRLATILFHDGGYSDVGVFELGRFGEGTGEAPFGECIVVGVEEVVWVVVHNNNNRLN